MISFDKKKTIFSLSEKAFSKWSRKNLLVYPTERLATRGTFSEVRVQQQYMYSVRGVFRTLSNI